MAVEPLRKTSADVASDEKHPTEFGLANRSDKGSVGQMLDRLTLPLRASSRASTKAQAKDESIEAELRRIELHERLLSANQLELEKRVGGDMVATSKDCASLVGRRFTFSGKSLVCFAACFAGTIAG